MQTEGSQMRHAKLAFAVAAFCALGLVAGTGTSTGLTAAEIGRAKARGEGTQVTGNSVAIRTFSFNAVTHSDGLVTGEAHVVNPAIGSDRHFALDCVNVFPGDNGSPIAVASGVVTSAENPALVGRPGIFAAQDNGEGTNEPLDRMTLGVQVLVDPVACTGFATETALLSQFPFGIVDIKSGNIQITS